MMRRRDSLRRRPPVREPKPEIVVVCEGKVTEVRYFTDFRSVCNNSLVVVTAIGGAGVPVSVVRRAMELRDERIRLARQTRDSFDLKFDVWAVFDRDAHPQGQVPAAIQLAKSNGIEVAFSNPCFEVWALMHLVPFDRPGHHHETQKELKRRLPGYCHETNPVFDLAQLQPNYDDAVRNARAALKRRQEEGDPEGDPSTGVFLLTERIRLFGRQ